MRERRWLHQQHLRANSITDGQYHSRARAREWCVRSKAAVWAGPMLWCLEPFGHQVPFVLFETCRVIKRLRGLVFSADLKAQRLDPSLFTQVFSKGDNRFAQLLPAVGLAQVQFIEQGKASVKFQAEAKRQSEVSGQFRATKDEIDLRQFWIAQRPVDRQGSCWFIETHFLLGVELAH